ncbi:hypothetical protein BJX66DRAFT_135567 [Aspergillus keveii]|uniref:Uncharacterized protein n=1 Tax=Aspergillus keveii TaxID=714993 RepID=A0ABR4GBN3_9EURO
MYEDRGHNGKLSELPITSRAGQSAGGDGLIAAISRGKARAVFVPRGFTPTVGGACILVASLLSWRASAMTVLQLEATVCVGFWRVNSILKRILYLCMTSFATGALSQIADKSN